jgi:homoserine O-acetyltransferase/O-succinyltransferase
VSPSNHLFEAGDLPLAGGGILREARIDYRLHGTPADDGGNLVLFPHMYSGGVESLDRHIGRGRALDPGRLCVLVPGQLGNGSATSPSNSRDGRLPELSVADDVEVQRRLVATLFGEQARLHLLIGYSMGALQAYAWAVDQPARVRRLMVLAGAARTSAPAAALLDTVEAALEGPHPLREHAELWRTLGVSPAVYDEEHWRRAGYSSAEEFTRAVFHEDLAAADPRDLLCQLGKWRSFDVSRQAGGDLARALGRIQAATCVMSFAGDPFAPPEQCAAEAALIEGARLQSLETPWGHYAFGGFDDRDIDAIDAAVSALLDGI